MADQLWVKLVVHVWTRDTSGQETTCNVEQTNNTEAFKKGWFLVYYDS